MRHRLLSALLLPLALTACSTEPTPVARPSAGTSVAAVPSPSPVSPAAVPSLSRAAEPSLSPAADPAPAAVALTGDGIDLGSRVMLFGRTPAQVLAPVAAAVGAPSSDTGVIASAGDYGVCPGEDLRVVEHSGGALRLYFGTEPGAGGQSFYAWMLTGEGPRGPAARALVGDSASFGFGVGTTRAQLQEGLGAALDVQSDEVLGVTFRVADQSTGLFGTLSSADPSGTVQTVLGGAGCGE